jgi:uncharacterized protein (TIGR03000 family)
MVRRLSLLYGSVTLSTVLFLTAADAHGPGGGHGGYHYGGFYSPHHGYAFYGPYRPGLYAPYGFYRPYYGYGFYGPGLAAAGFGLGLGLGYGLGGYGMYRPYYGGTTIVAPTVVVAPPAGGTGIPPVGGVGGTGVPPADGIGGTGVPPVGQTQPPPDNAAHLQLAVPENAEVLFGGDKTTQTGPVREFVSPPLPSGKVFDYTIVVRYTDANGKAVTDRRVIHVRANDWFRIDFTRPAPPEPLPAP